jgi:glycerophosphoryl diester phosphodiesterase
MRCDYTVDRSESMLRASPMIYAHRGASAELPENTLAAFARALEVGADAIETDAHMTRDGRIVLSHDPHRIPQQTLEQVRAWKPDVATLDEALERFPGVVFNVDAKQTEPDMIPALLRSIHAARAADRVRIASFSTRNLERARELGYEGETGMSSKEIARVMFLPRAALRWVRVPGHAAQVPRRAYGVRFDTQAAIDRFHELGLRVDFWTIDDPEEARRLFAMGADGVMTDDPRRLCAGLGRG